MTNNRSFIGATTRIFISPLGPREHLCMKRDVVKFTSPQCQRHTNFQLILGICGASLSCNVDM